MAAGEMSEEKALPTLFEAIDIYGEQVVWAALYAFNLSYPIGHGDAADHFNAMRAAIKTIGDERAVETMKGWKP